MKKLNIKTKKVANLKPNPLFEGLPERLKDIEAYHKLENKLAEVVKTNHKHKTVREYVTCAWCNKKREMRTEVIKSEGFTSMNQYMEWKKIMQIINDKKNFILR